VERITLTPNDMKTKEQELTPKQQWMLNFLKVHSNEFVSPTYVGRSYGHYVLNTPGHHSSTASPTLLKLTKMGLIERNKKGHYKYITIASENKQSDENKKSY